MRYYVLDFETRSTVDLKTRGLSNYANNTNTEVLCYALQEVNSPYDAPLRSYDIRNPDYLAPLLTLLRRDDVDFIAHNALFEYEICRTLLLRIGATPPALERFYCTAAMASRIGLPASLESVAQVVLGVGKLDTGKALIDLFSKPNKQGAFNTPDLYKERFEQMIQYCKRDVQLTGQLWKLLPPLNPLERQLCLATWRMNRRGFFIDRESVNEVCADVAVLQQDCADTLQGLTGGVITKATQSQRLLKWLQSRGLSVASVSSDTLQNALNDPDLPADLSKVIWARLGGGKATFGKYKAIQNHLTSDNRIRHSFKYCGAHTGRLSGVGVQPQNFKSGSTFKAGHPLHGLRSPELLAAYKAKGIAKADLTEALVGAVRAVVTAPESHMLYIADYAGIEARIAFWLAGDETVLQRFRNGEDVYKPMAAHIFNIPVSQVTQEQRNKYGKVTILGCAYGMGATKFSEQYHLPLQEGIRCVDAYRSLYPKVTQMWKSLEAAFSHTLRTGQSTEVNRVRFERGKNFVIVTPPGGRSLYYYKPAIDAYGQLTKTGVKKDGTTYPMKLWGGVLLENICQNIAGAIIGYATLNVEQLGMQPVLQVHDELVCEVFELTDTKRLDVAMLAMPDGVFDGLPLAIESKISKRFTK